MEATWAPWIALMVGAVCWELLRRKAKKLQGAKRLPPGPRGWPIFGSLFGLGVHPVRYFNDLHKKYGSLVFLRLANMPVVITNDPQLMKMFMQDNDLAFASRPPTIANQYFTYGGQDFALAPHGPQWKFMRRIAVQEVLLPKKMEACSAERLKEADYLVQQILKSSKCGQPADMREILAAYSMNLLTRMMVGRQHFGIDEHETALAKNSIHQGFYLLGVMNLADYFPFLKRFDIQGLKKKMDQVLTTLEPVLDREIEGRRKALEANEPPKYIVDTLLTIPGPNGNDLVPRDAIRVMMLDMIAGGTDTSSIINEWTMTEMVLNPRVQRKAQAEIDEIVGKDRKVDESDLVKFTYINACIRETFRLHPPGPFNVPHYSTEDTTINGYHIPKGTTLFPNIYGMGRSVELWGESVLEYKPERWLTPEEVMIHDQSQGTSNKADVRDRLGRILPFGIGRRSCPAYSLGTTVVLLGISRLLHSFDWHAPPGQVPDLREAAGLTSPPLIPLKLMAVPRLAPHLYD